MNVIITHTAHLESEILNSVSLIKIEPDPAHPRAVVCYIHNGDKIHRLSGARIIGQTPHALMVEIE